MKILLNKNKYVIMLTFKSEITLRLQREKNKKQGGSPDLRIFFVVCFFLFRQLLEQVLLVPLR